MSLRAWWMCGVLGISGWLSAGCGDNLRFQVERAPDYQQGSAVSVFGVFKDGRMSVESWDDFGPKLVHKEGCVAGYDARFIAANRALSSAIDDQVRSNGVSDALLAKLAPAATGDSILVLTISGKPPKSVEIKSSSRAVNSQRGKPSMGSTETISDGNAFEVSASVYSIRQKQRVARLSMRYTGEDTNDALKKFGDQFASEFPMNACAGWNWQVAIDEKQIRDIKEE